MEELPPERNYTFEFLQIRCAAFNKTIHGESLRVKFNEPFAFVSHMMYRDQLNSKIRNLIEEQKSYSLMPLIDGSFVKKYFPAEIGKSSESSLLDAYVMEVSEWNTICNIIKHEPKAVKLEEYVNVNKSELLKALERRHWDYFKGIGKSISECVTWEKKPHGETQYKYVPIPSISIAQDLREEISGVLPLAVFNLS